MWHGMPVPVLMNEVVAFVHEPFFLWTKWRVIRCGNHGFFLLLSLQLYALNSSLLPPMYHSNLSYLPEVFVIIHLFACWRIKDLPSYNEACKQKTLKSVWIQIDQGSWSHRTWWREILKLHVGEGRPHHLLKASRNNTARYAVDVFLKPDVLTPS